MYRLGRTTCGSAMRITHPLRCTIGRQQLSTSTATAAVRRRRVVVTGVGVVTPLGVGLSHVWPRLIRGESGVQHIGSILGVGNGDASGEYARDQRWTTEQTRALAASPYPYAVELGNVLSQLPSKIAAFVPRGSGLGEFDLNQMVDRSIRQSTSPFIHFALVAAREALTQARWGVDAANKLSTEQLERTGVAIGSGIGSVEESYDAGRLLHTPTSSGGGVRRVSPHGIPRLLINLAAGHVSMAYGFRGPNHAVSTACATGANAIGDAARFIEYGDADVMIAGGSEAAVTPISLTLFSRCRALATKYNAQPNRASRPFDRERDGFVMGEGAGVVVLESYEHAKARGATVLAELSGYGLSADAHHITAPDPSGSGAARCMRMALRHAGISDAKGLGYVNAHATSTPAGDNCELAALRTVCGGERAAAALPISSTKGATGHLLGGAGAVEAIFAINALRTNQLPPTLNCTSPDDEFKAWNLLGRKPFVPSGSEPAPAPIAPATPLTHVLTNSFGFGGVNASLVFSKPE